MPYPVFSATRHGRLPSRSRAAFALVVALALMSMLLLLLVALGTVLQLEIRSGSDNRNLTLARENARLGLMMALGELQKHAGPDQRITARAEMLGDSVSGGNRFWTGVWDATNPSAPPVWLVSGDSLDPTSFDPTTSSTSIRLVGPGSTGNDADLYVFAESVELPDGGYAWWIGDEGVKASIGATDQLADLDLPGYEAVTDPQYRDPNTWRRERLRKTLGAIFNIEDSLGFPSNFTHRQGANGVITKEALEKLLRLEQLLHVDAFGFNEDYIHTHHHDFTPSNRFVLSNTLDGGLKQDLTHLRRMAPPDQAQLDTAYNSPQWDYLTPELHAFVNFDQVLNLDPMQLPPVLVPDLREDHMDQRLGFSTVPVVTELVFSAGFAARNLAGGAGGTPTRDVYLYFFLITEILNPYPWSLGLNNDRGPNTGEAEPGDPSDVLVRISNFPPITIINQTQGYETEIDLADLVVAVGVNSFNDHAPGFMRPNFSPTSNVQGDVTGRGVFGIKIGELIEIPEIGDDFEVVFGVSDLKIELYESNTHPPAEPAQWAYFLTTASKAPGVPVFAPDNDPAEGPRKFQEWNLRNWGDFSIEYEGTQPNGELNHITRFVRGGRQMQRSRSTSSGVTTGGLNDGLVNFGVHAKFVDEWNESLGVDEAGAPVAQGLDELFTLADLRQRVIEIDMEDSESGDGVFFDVAWPDDMDRLNFMKDSDFFRGADSGSTTDNRLARLYDLPNQEPASVAAFNQMYFDGFPHQPLANRLWDREPPLISGTGNLPGESLNNYFDRYFFSTLPVDVQDWDRLSPLPNSKIKLAVPPDDADFDLLASPQSAEQLYVADGFNINSVSNQAWASLLNPRAIDRFLYTRAPSSGQRLFQTVRVASNMGNVFFSMPFGGDNHVESTSPTFSLRRAPQASALPLNIITRGPHEAFIQGIRELTPTQANELGAEIAERVQEFGEREQRPFLSLTEFLNEGILQAAIDAVPSINRPGVSGERRIPTLAPAFVSAGSLLNTLAPYLFARSDTFLIRSHGYVENPLTGDVVSRANLEALVQRLPEMDASGDGRLFKVVRLRWLDDEIL